jgi:hypothetical protein
LVEEVRKTLLVWLEQPEEEHFKSLKAGILYQLLISKHTDREKLNLLDEIKGILQERLKDPLLQDIFNDR